MCRVERRHNGERNECSEKGGGKEGERSTTKTTEGGGNGKEEKGAKSISAHEQRDRGEGSLPRCDFAYWTFRHY